MTQLWLLLRRVAIPLPLTALLLALSALVGGVALQLAGLAIVAVILTGACAMCMSARRAGRPPLRRRLEQWDNRRWHEALPSERRITLGRIERAQDRLRRTLPRVARRGVMHTVLKTNPWQLAFFVAMPPLGVAQWARGDTVWWASALSVLLGPAIVWLRFRLERRHALRTLSELGRFAQRVRAKLVRLPQVRVLVLTTTPVETVSVLDAVTMVNETPPDRHHDGTSVVWRLGAIGAHEILLAQSVEPGNAEPGNAEPGGAMLVADEVLQANRAEVVILVGGAHGLRAGQQNLGEVVVAQRLVAVGPGGVSVPPSVVLLDRADAAAAGWEHKVHFGTVLSSEPHLLTELDRLRVQHPDAIALETHGIGVYAVAARRLRTAWIVIQAIAGWGALHPRDERAAAAAAAGFVVHLLQVSELSSAL
jgi:nucleoside phosphorylase